jgi:hypothetical protein
MPFKVKDSTLLEMPFSVIKSLRIPLGLSYMQNLGIGSFIRLMKLLGIPDLIIFDFHPFELVKVPSFSLLPLRSKIYYLRSQKFYKDPSLVFEEFVKFTLGRGYASKYLIDVYEEFRAKAPEWSWMGD